MLANICHEYKSFGTEAFVNNKLRYVMIEIDNKTFVARPVFNFILCFVCKKEVNLGLIRSKVEMLAQYLEHQFEPMREQLERQEDEDQV